MDAGTAALAPLSIRNTSALAAGHDHFLRIENVGRRDLVHHIGGRVAEHAPGTDAEYLYDALLVAAYIDD